MKKTTLLLAACCLALTIVIAQQHFIKTDLSTLAEESKLVKAGPNDIYIHKKGMGQSVVFVSDIGDDHKAWLPLQDSLSAFAQTISYDRAGLGKSGLKSSNKDLPSMARELRKVLESAKANKPYILTGVSFGCQVIKQFAAMFPDEVKGLVFIDPAINEQKLHLTLPESVWQKRENLINSSRPKVGAAREAEIEALNRNCAIADDITILPEVPAVLFSSTKLDTTLPGNIEAQTIKMQTHELWVSHLKNAERLAIEEYPADILANKSSLVIDRIKKMLE